MTFDDEMDSYDPVIADRFALLDRVSPVEMSAAAPVSADPPRIGRPAEAARPLSLMAAAAATVAVAGIAVFALARNGSDQDVEATNSGDDQAEVEENGQVAVEDENRSLTVEVPDPAGEQGDSASATTAGDDGEAGDESTPTTADNQLDDSQTTGPSTAEAITTESSEPTETSGASTTSTTTPSTTTTSSGSTATTESSLPAPGSSWLNPPTPEKTIVIRGMVTEVFTDCQSRLVLNDAGEVESVGPVSCDGGSYIIVNGNRIHTTAGFVASEDYYAKHPSDLRPGQNVAVTAVRSASAGGILTLDCVLCTVKLSG